MIEVYGDLWEYAKAHNAYAVCITTNGTAKKNGCAVMGRGCAAEAKARYPGIDLTLGRAIANRGLHLLYIQDNIWAFPVKYKWWEAASLLLIEQSAKELDIIAHLDKGNLFILPRPGCGNGQLSWSDVKPVISFLPDNIHVIT